MEIIFLSSLFDFNNNNNNWAIGLMSRVFANGPGDRGSNPGQGMPKTQKNGSWYHLA